MEHGDITRVVNGIGEVDEREALSREIYEQLRVCVRSVLAGEYSGMGGPVGRQDLTMLVHECWLKLQNGSHWESRAHYFGAASRATRQILIDMARQRQRRPSAFSFHEGLDPSQRSELMNPELSETIDRIGTALEGLEAVAPRAAKIASYRLFGDLPTLMIAQEEGISERMVQRDWKFAQAWLASRLANHDMSTQSPLIMSPATASDA